MSSNWAFLSQKVLVAALWSSLGLLCGGSQLKQRCMMQQGPASDSRPCQSLGCCFFPKHFPAGQLWHDECSVMLRQYERSSGTTGSVDRWPLHLRHTKRSPRRKHESSFRQMFLPASLQNAAITPFVFRALTIMLQCGEITVYLHGGQQGLRVLMMFAPPSWNSLQNIWGHLALEPPAAVISVSTYSDGALQK